MEIPFLSIQLTSKCNMDCWFCFRRLKLEELSEEEMTYTIDKLCELSPETIVLWWGEPFLRKDIFKIINQIRVKNIKVVVQSNGLLLNKDIVEKLSWKVDWISLSLDWDNEDTNSLFRWKNHFNKIISLLPIINKNNIKIKLWTVINKQNIDNVIWIWKYIWDYVNYWKLYQFYPREECISSDNENEYYISNEEYLSIVEKIIDKYPDINISKHTLEDFKNSPCILTHPGWEVTITKWFKDISIWNFITDIEWLKQKLVIEWVYSTVDKNYSKTYKKD